MINNLPLKGKMVTLSKKKEEIYEGEFKKIMYHGKGTLTVKKEYIYSGDF
jgi:hypothetical protein